MTIEEAINHYKFRNEQLEHAKDYEHMETSELKEIEEHIEYNNMAIRSLEAWEKIRKEIASDGQSDINAKYVLNLIDKHLSEVSE